MSASRYVCHSQTEIETADGGTETLVCTMTGLHESHRATVFWSPTEAEVDEMVAADEGVNTP